MICKSIYDQEHYYRDSDNPEVRKTNALRDIRMAITIHGCSYNESVEVLNSIAQELINKEQGRLATLSLWGEQ